MIRNRFSLRRPLAAAWGYSAWASAVLACGILACGILACTASSLSAQQRGLHIGYVYPAGGQQGSSFEVVIGGQFLTGVSSVDVVGGGVRAEIIELVQPITTKELNELRITADELLARKAVVKNDFRALEAFRSFKTTKTDKPEAKQGDEELDQLRRKYADAVWTDDDEMNLLELRRKLASAVRRPANPAIGELAIVRVSVAPDAKRGRRELRVASATELSNPLTFHVGSLPEVSAPAIKSITEQVSSIQKTGPTPKGKNSLAETPISLPTVVNGQIMPGKMERYRFQAKKGEQLVVVASARELIPYIADAVPGWFQATLAIYDADGKELAYDDDFQFNPDPVLYCQIPADGEYVVEIKDAIFRGREDFVYRLTVGALPFVTSVFPLGGPAGVDTEVTLQGWNLPVDHLTVRQPSTTTGLDTLADQAPPWLTNQVPFDVDTLPECMEVESPDRPNDQRDQAQPLQLPIIVNGRIARPDDQDVFSFHGRAGDDVVIEVLARRLNSPLDSMLKLTDASGKQLALNDDYEDKAAGLTTHQADSLLRLTLPSDGRYFVHLVDMQHQGSLEHGYRLRLSPPRPDFELRVAPSSINARAGGTIPLTVFALRKDGFAGDIRLKLKHEDPSGFVLRGNVIPAGQDQVRATLTAPAMATDQPRRLQLEGTALIAGKEVSHPVVPAEDMMQAFAYRHLVPSRELKVQVANSGFGFGRGALQLVDDSPVQIRVGGTGRIRFATPTYLSLDKLQLHLNEPPDGIVIQQVVRTRQGVEVVLAGDAAKVQPGQKGNLILAVSSSNPSGGNGNKSSPKKGSRELVLPAVPYEVTP